MNQRDRIIKIAASQIGYKETGDDWTKYGAWYGMNGNPWCAMFVSWCANQAQIPQGIIPKLAYVPYIVNFFLQRGRYKARGSYTPRKGDIVFFGDSDHVGLVEGVSGNNVITIEGNTSSGGNVSDGEGVYRRVRPLGSGSWVMGFGIPNYQEEDDDVEIREIQLKSKDTGNEVTANAILYKGENYVRLRDVPKIAPLAIGYEDGKPTFDLVYK